MIIKSENFYGEDKGPVYIYLFSEKEHNVVKTGEVVPGKVFFDYNEDNELVGIEIL